MEQSVDQRCETVRGTHWPPAGRQVVWSSHGANHLGQRLQRSHQQAGHMDASDPISPKSSCATGAVHISVPGLLGCSLARDDSGMSLHDVLHSRGTICPSYASSVAPQKTEGAGKAGCCDRTRSLVCKIVAQSTHTSHTGTPKHSGIPCAMVLRLIRALVSANCARMCERAVLTNRPSLDLSPSVLEGLESLPGSVGQTRCLPQPEQLHGPFEPGPSKEGSG